MGTLEMGKMTGHWRSGRFFSISCWKAMDNKSCELVPFSLSNKNHLGNLLRILISRPTETPESRGSCNLDLKKKSQAILRSQF